MREWLANSGTVPDEEVARLIDTHEELQVCADICNGTKHYRQRWHRIDDRFLIGREYVPGDIADTHAPGVDHFVIAGDTKFLLLNLAARCIELWEELLREKGLL